MRFPDLPIYRGFNAPGRIEADILDLEVEGSIPADLDGVFYRVGPDPQWPPLHGTDIYFNGDGMVSAFRFQGGHVDFKCRYVRTEKFLLESDARRALFGTYRNPLSDDPSVRGRSRGTANTNIVFHAGQLLALKEDSLPIALDPLSLETLGPTTFADTLHCPTFTAHPKLDPHSGELIAFGYDAAGVATPDVAFLVVGPQRRVTRQVWFKVPYSCMIHDFAVTRRHVIFPVVPLTSSQDRLRQGASNFAWDGRKDVYLGVLPRDGGAADIRWFRGPTEFVSHVMNAFEDGERIHLDVPVAESNAFPFFPDVSGAPFDPRKADFRLQRWTLDLASKNEGYARKTLSDVTGEFPRIDERYAMEPYRHGYMTVQDLSKPYDAARAGSITGMFWNSIGHVDHLTNRTSTDFAGPTSSFQEPTFVPKSAASAEGEGYLLALANRYEQMRSDLLLWDARRISDGPLATIRLPLRLRNGLHGTWVEGSQLPRSKQSSQPRP